MKELDFLPPIYRRRKRQRRLLWYQCFALAVMAVAMGAWLHAQRTKLAGESAKLTKMKQRLENLQQGINQLSHVPRLLQEYRQQWEILRRIAPRYHVTEILAELAHCAAGPLTLTKLQLQPDTRTARAAAQNPRRTRTVSAGAKHRKDTSRHARQRYLLQLRGVAPSDVEVANFIGRLGESPMFRNVTMKISRNSSKGGRRMREFELTCELVDSQATKER